MKKFLFSLLFFSSAFCADPIYDYINEIPVDLHGWFGINNQNHLSSFFRRKDIKSVIELGSWTGLSTVFFARKVGPDGVVFAVDTWLGSEAEEVHQRDPRLNHLYQLFLSNVKQKSLQDVIVPIRMRTSEAAKALSITADLIYVDADHRTEGVRNDIIDWYPHLNEGGIMCGDDWDWPSVRKGVIQAAHELGKQVKGSIAFWWFEEDSR
ncbi:MAG: hypothetical protein KR126chlam1_01116 [Chlamydiae bacterium]|nr:hypothetical protein [Chlamydiota bacterium]